MRRALSTYSLPALGLVGCIFGTNPDFDEVVDVETGDGDEERGDGDGDGDEERGDGDGDGDGDTGGCGELVVTSEDFESGGYGGGLGSWLSPWVEAWPGGDDDPDTLPVNITSDLDSLRLQIRTVLGSPSGARRRVNLGGACAVELSFAYRVTGYNPQNEEVLRVHVRSDQDTDWVLIDQFETSPALEDDVLAGPYDITEFAGPSAELRFRSVGPGHTPTARSYIDDITIAAMIP